MVRTLRRAVTLLGVTAAIAGFLRLRGSGGTPPRRGGWRELDPDEFQAP